MAAIDIATIRDPAGPHPDRGALICDGSLFLKDLPAARALIPDPATGAPYPGARPHILADALLDEPERLRAAVRALADALPAPKPKKPRKPKG